VSDLSDNWDDLETWDDLEAGEGSSSRTRIWIIWALAGVVLLLLVWFVWVAALLNPDNYRFLADPTSPVTFEQGGEAQIGSGPNQTSAWLAFWIGTHVLMQVVGLSLIARRRRTMTNRLIVKWSLLILLVPIAGVLGYYFYLLEGAIQRGVPGRQEEPASFLRSPGRRM
jgi:hypothetical protein